MPYFLTLQVVFETQARVEKKFSSHNLETICIDLSHET